MRSVFPGSGGHSVLEVQDPSYKIRFTSPLFCFPDSGGHSVLEVQDPTYGDPLCLTCVLFPRQWRAFSAGSARTLATEIRFTSPVFCFPGSGVHSVLEVQDPQLRDPFYLTHVFCFPGSGGHLLLEV